MWDVDLLYYTILEECLFCHCFLKIVIYGIYGYNFFIWQYYKLYMYSNQYNISNLLSQVFYRLDCLLIYSFIYFIYYQKIFIIIDILSSFYIVNSLSKLITMTSLFVLLFYQPHAVIFSCWIILLDIHFFLYSSLINLRPFGNSLCFVFINLQFSQSILLS